MTNIAASCLFWLDQNLHANTHVILLSVITRSSLYIVLFRRSFFVFDSFCSRKQKEGPPPVCFIYIKNLFSEIVCTVHER